jgi:hypothetical protein
MLQEPRMSEAQSMTKSKICASDKNVHYNERSQPISDPIFPRNAG